MEQIYVNFECVENGYLLTLSTKRAEGIKKYVAKNQQEAMRIAGDYLNEHSPDH